MENKIIKRSGDLEKSHYRTGRFYSVENEWYFSVRETGEQGPYMSKLSAEIGLKMYLLDIEHFKEKKTSSTFGDLKLL